MQPTFLSPVAVRPIWQPLLEGDLAARAQAALDGVIKALPLRFEGSGVAGGDAGAALFFEYLGQAQPGQGWEDRAAAHLDQAITALGENVHGPSLYVGFTGIAWVMDHLQSGPFAEDPNEDIDAALDGYLNQGPWRGDYDLIGGLVGYGLYGLDRGERPSGRRLLQRIITILDETKTELPPGFTWHTSPELLPAWQRELSPQGYYNLGLAHGVPAVIALLGQACAAGVNTERALPLLEGAVAWLLAQKQPEGSGSCFGTMVSVGQESETSSSRIAWCYGDLGLAVALLWAARSVSRADWEREALSIARLAARRPVAEAGVRDAGLCHGAAGNAHLFNRLWQATGEACFREAALAWFEATLVFWKPEKGIGGFQAWSRAKDDADQDAWRDVEGLLEGAVGIGLALMAGLYPTPPNWDRVLLVSLPPGPTVRR